VVKWNNGRKWDAHRTQKGRRRDAKGTHIGRTSDAHWQMDARWTPDGRQMDARWMPNGRQSDAKCRSRLRHPGMIALAGLETPAYFLPVLHYQKGIIDKSLQTLVQIENDPPEQQSLIA
jgi:hypothetical protein